jgi:hypothetical protein
MKFPAVARWIALALALGLTGQAADRRSSLPEQWRQEHRIIDLHQHVNGTEEHVSRWLRIMDRVGVGVGVNLSGGTVTAKPGELSAFERTQALTERLAPGRAVLYFNLDYTGWDQPGFAERAIEQVNRAHALGAAGLKEYKRLGLFLRDQQGQLIRIDDSRLDGVWKRCGELGLPVSIHVADPKAFWLPYTAQNERWKELKDHRSWWFGDPKQFPTREKLLEALSLLGSQVVSHPATKACTLMIPRLVTTTTHQKFGLEQIPFTCHPAQRPHLCQWPFWQTHCRPSLCRLHP